VVMVRFDDVKEELGSISLELVNIVEIEALLTEKGYWLWAP